MACYAGSQNKSAAFTGNGAMKTKRNITIKDIAVRAGTSVATASRALGGYGNISLDLMIVNVRVPFFSLLVRAVEDFSMERGSVSSSATFDDDREKEWKYLSLLWSRRVDGLKEDGRNFE
jgi:DNA-binding LacI/PurR family transcriptional regulator